MKPVTQDQINNEVLHHIQIDPHKRASGLSDFILGAQDGLGQRAWGCAGHRCRHK
jgi:hypothetical protein